MRPDRKPLRERVAAVIDRKPFQRLDAGQDLRPGDATRMAMAYKRADAIISICYLEAAHVAREELQERGGIKRPDHMRLT